MISRPLPEADTDETAGETSPTQHLIEQITLFGVRRGHDGPDYRPLPESTEIRDAVANVFDILVDLLGPTRLEDDLPHVLWSITNVLHRQVAHIEKVLDDNEQKQRHSQREQDGSEVKSVELEQLTAEGGALVERRDAFEAMRDVAADQYAVHTGSIWLPRTGSKVSGQTMTSAILDSRDFVAAGRRRKTEMMCPEGTLIVVAGGQDYDNLESVCAALDRTKEKYPDMVLLHGGSPKGAEKLAACWAANHGVPQVAFKPDWNRHAKAAPFKRNDQLLEQMPKGVIVFPGNGIHENLRDKAKKMGIPVYEPAKAR